MFSAVWLAAAIPPFELRTLKRMRGSRAAYLFEDVPYVRFGRSVIGNAQLPLGIKLSQYRLDSASQPVLARVEGRHENAYPRTTRKYSYEVAYPGDLRRIRIHLRELGCGHQPTCPFMLFSDERTDNHSR